MKLHIYLFRHGQTYYNKDHIFTGWKDSKLTPKGIKQAKIVAKKLKNKKFQVAVKTTLSRSKDTLKYVLKYHPECKKIMTDNSMIERSYGKLEGRHHSELVKESGTRDYKTLLHWHKIDHLGGKERQEFIKKHGEADLHIIRRSYKTVPPKGESVEMVEKRVKEFIKDMLIYMKMHKVNIAISAHGNSMRPFRRYFEHLSINQMMKLENPFDDYFEYTINVK